MSTSYILPIGDVSFISYSPSRVGLTHLNRPYGIDLDIAQPYRLLPINNIIKTKICIYLFIN